MHKKLTIATVLLLSLLAGNIWAADKNADPYANETPAQRDARMKWFREARFGMFIHWGVYSVPAGTYRGKKIGGIGEWIMNSASIPCAEYQAYAKEFNPVKYNPEEWVKIAKDAGMKYIVITSKHHDGFALFKSKASKWNVVDATPYGQDLLKPLAAACKKEGIKLGFYYSQAQDWNNPGGGAYHNPPHWDKAQDGDFDEYVKNIAIPQVKEILTNYGDVAVLWWDTAMNMKPESAAGLISCLKLQPGIIHNNRLGNGYNGDTETPEQEIPATGFPGGRDWETCMTINDTWGYKSYDTNFKSTETLVRNLVDIASKGGNYLLNVGPTSEGLIPQPEIDRLKEVGQWMHVNGEAIYATTSSPFKRLPWGRCTKKVTADGTTLYLHVFDWPKDGQLVVSGLKNKVKSAALLAEPAKELKFEASTDPAGVTITVPAAAPDKICSVVVCKIEGAPEVEPTFITADKDGAITFPASEATIKGHTARFESGENRNSIGFWTNPDDTVEWTFRAGKDNSFQVEALTAALGDSKIEVIIASKTTTLTATLNCPKTGDYGKFETTKGAQVSFSDPGIYTLTVKPIKEDWQPLNLRSIRLVPSKK